MKTLRVFSIDAILSLACSVLVAPAAAHCIVVGSADARVQSAEGVLTPVATSHRCESLRLLSGTAKAMWTQQDGRPGAAVLRPDRGPDGYPAGSDTTPQDRFKQVLAALHGDGASVRAGYKRFDNAGEINDVYADPAGIPMPWTGPGLLELSALQGRSIRPLGSMRIPAGQRVQVPAQALQAMSMVRVEFRQDGQSPVAMVLRRLPEGEQLGAAQALQGLAQLQALAPQEQALARAMVFENLGLSFQCDMALLP